MNERHCRLVELEHQLCAAGIDPTGHEDADLEAILEAQHNWLGDE
jgi:hypothetical protein